MSASKFNELNYIPIDFIKAQVIGIHKDKFINNPYFGLPVWGGFGDLLTYQIYRYKNLRIKIFENNDRIEFSGSLHAFYNDGKHNYNDFGIKAFNEALERLDETLGIRPENLYLIHVEWGYNIKPPKNANYIIDRLVKHISTNKTVGVDDPTDGKYVQFKHSNYILKIYNKGLQFKLPEDVLRIEIKQTNWSEYRLKGIETLQDFIEANKAPFFNKLLRQWEKVVLYDIDNSRSEEFIKYQTVTFWDDRRLNYSDKNYKYHFDKLKRLNKEIGFNTQNLVSQLLFQKGKELQL